MGRILQRAKRFASARILAIWLPLAFCLTATVYVAAGLFAAFMALFLWTMIGLFSMEGDYE